MTERRMCLPEDAGTQLFEWRTAHGLSLKKMADLLGTSKTTYGRIENGARDVPKDLGERISAVLEKGAVDQVQTENDELPEDLRKLRKEVELLRKLVSLQQALINIYEDERASIRRHKVEAGKDFLIPEGLE